MSSKHVLVVVVLFLIAGPALLLSRDRLKKQELVEAHFVDVSSEAGVDRRAGDTGTFGVVWTDLDGDSLQDIVVSNHSSPPSFYYQRSGGFQHLSTSVGIRTEGSYEEWRDRHGLSCADYDRDGDIDVFFTHGAAKGLALATTLDELQYKTGDDFFERNGRGLVLGVKFDELLRNNGDGTLKEATSEAGVANAYGRARSASWIDYDRDGWLDLYIGNMLTPNVLYCNNSDGTFSDVTDKAGLSEVEGVTCGWSDYDQDGWPDALLLKPIRLMHNQGDGSFKDVTENAGLEPIPHAMGIAWGDYSGDGFDDLFVVSRQLGSSELFRNTGEGTFVRVELELGQDQDDRGMAAEWGDLDNDGWLDLCYMTEKSLAIFRNEAGELRKAAEIESLKPGLRADIALADYDRDGLLDAALATSTRHYLFRGTVSEGNWLGIILEGTTSNRDGIGARLVVYTEDLVISRQHTGGAGVTYSTGYSQIHMGVGRASEVDLHVYWPSGCVQCLRGIEVNQVILITESCEMSTGCTQ